MSVDNCGPAEVIVIDDDYVSTTPPLPPPPISDIDIEDEVVVLDMAAATEITLVMPSWGETVEESVSEDACRTATDQDSNILQANDNEDIEDTVKDLMQSMLAELDDKSFAYRGMQVRNSSVKLSDGLEVYDIASEPRENFVVYSNPEEPTLGEGISECVHVEECEDSTNEISMASNYLSFEIADDEIVPQGSDVVRSDSQLLGICRRKAESESQEIVDVLFKRVDIQDRTIVDLEVKVRKLESLLEDRDRELASSTLACEKEKISHLETTINVLEERLQTFSKDKEDLTTSKHQAEAELSELRQRLNEVDLTRLAAELDVAIKAADEMRAGQRDKDARIAMLEIDVEYARDQEKVVTDELDLVRETCQKDIESINEELSREKEINSNLRHNLKEQMKQRIRELKIVTESEKEVFVKQVAKLKEQEVDYLRKLHDLRTNHEVLVSQMRDLRADVKAKDMESEAYRDVAEKLKQVVTALEKDNARLEQKVKHLLREGSKNGVTYGPEVITIDTDDAESSDDDKCLKNLRESHNTNFSSDSKASPSAKRDPSSRQAGDVSVGAKIAVQIVEETVTMVTDDKVVTEVVEEAAQCSLVTEVENSLLNQVGYLETKLRNMTAANHSLKDQFASLRHKAEAEKVSGTDGLPWELNSSAEIDRIVSTRDSLEPTLSSLSEELLAEKAKVETLECKLRHSACTQEKVLTDQQNRLEELQQCLTNLEAELEERHACVAILKEENGALRDSYYRLADENDEECQKFKDLTGKYDGISRTLQAILEERDRLQKQVAVLEAGQVGLEELKGINATLETKLSVAHSEHERLNQILKDLEEKSKKAESMEQYVEELKVGIEAAHQQRSDLTDQLTKRQREVDRIMVACKQTIALADEERKTVLQQCQESNIAGEELRSQVTKISHVNEVFQEQMEVFRAKVNDAERQLSEKDAVIALLRSESVEFQVQQESAKIRTNNLQEEVVSTKQKLAQTEKMLEDASNTAKLLERRKDEQKAEADRKQKLFKDITAKFSAFEMDLNDSLNEQKDVRKRLMEFKGIVTDDSSQIVNSKALRDEVAEFQRTLDQKKLGLREIEADVLRDVSSLARVEKCNLESSVARNRLRTELRQVKDELNTASAVSEDLRAELKSLREENGTLAAKVRSLEVLANRVEGLGTAEAKLNQGVSQLEEVLMEDYSSQQKVTKVLGVEMDDAQSILSKLKATADALPLGASDGQAEMSSSSSEQKNTISWLEEQATVLTANNEALQNRLNMALANGRRMETLLQTMQQSSCVSSRAKLDLNTVQSERDDLIGELAESKDLVKLLQAKVINLTKIVRKLQGKPCEQHDVYVINLDDGEDDSGLCKDMSNSKETSSKPTVLAPSRLSQQVNITKQNEIGKRPCASDQLQCVANKRRCAQSAAVQIERTVSKSHSSDNERALSTITNAIHHSTLVVAQDRLPTRVQLPQRATSSQSVEECQVQ